MNGEYRADALFQLALSAAQHADLPRAVSYFEQLEAVTDVMFLQDLVALLASSSAGD